ncbi:MAG: trypsin-like peptidase domain-containing protein [Deltaproteobacteria bacterium]|nr:trypsin-like peptidase domain-containing protein [Deltaproteobacteria bacterium]
MKGLKRALILLPLLLLLAAFGTAHPSDISITALESIQQHPSYPCFLELLTEALNHPNLKDRHIQTIEITLPETPVPSSLESGLVTIPFDPNTSYEDLVDFFIEHSVAHPTHAFLLPVVRLEGDHGTKATGFFLDEEGYIVTNSHMVQENTFFKVELLSKDLKMEKNFFSAVAIAKDDFTDVGLIKLVDPEINRFHSLYQTIPHIYVDHRTWALQKIRAGEAFTVTGFPRYARALPTQREGIVLEAFISQWGVGRHLTTFESGPGFSGAPLFSSEGYVLGICHQVVRLQNDRSDQAIMIDFESALYTLAQLKENQKIEKDLFIFKKGNTFEKMELPRPFEYTTLWTTDPIKEYLTIEHLVFTNAWYRAPDQKPTNCGVLVWQNHFYRPSFSATPALQKAPLLIHAAPTLFSDYAATWIPSKTVLINMEGIPLSQETIYESSLLKFSWLLRTLQNAHPNIISMRGAP